MIPRSLLILSALILAGGTGLAQEDPYQSLRFGELQIVGEPDPAAAIFEPETQVEAGLSFEETADRHSYRAAEYAIQAERFRLYASQASWPGMHVYGDRYVSRLFEAWAKPLDEAAEGSRDFALRYRLIAFEPSRLAMR